eukprot:1888220-Lingulodinium_polyedra.AAC.1
MARSGQPLLELLGSVLAGTVVGQPWPHRRDSAAELRLLVPDHPALLRGSGDANLLGHGRKCTGLGRFSHE